MSPEKFERNVLRVTEKAEYICQFCGSGSNNRSDVFEHGSCSHCGAGAKEVDIEYTERTFPHLKEQIFLVNANDVAKEAKIIKEGIEKRGIQIITLEDVLPNGIAQDEIPFILERVTQEVPFVLFMPSQELDEGDNDDVIMHTLTKVHFRRHRGKAAAILTDPSKDKLVPFELGSYPGICMTGDHEGHGMYFGLDTLYKRWIPQMKSQIEAQSN